MNDILAKLGAPPEGYGGIYEDHTPAENREKVNKIKRIGERYIDNISKAKKITDPIKLGYWRFEEDWFHEPVSRNTYMGLNQG